MIELTEARGNEEEVQYGNGKTGRGSVTVSQISTKPEDFNLPRELIGDGRPCPRRYQAPCHWSCVTVVRPDDLTVPFTPVK